MNEVNNNKRFRIKTVRKFDKQGELQPTYE